MRCQSRAQADKERRIKKCDSKTDFFLSSIDQFRASNRTGWVTAHFLDLTLARMTTTTMTTMTTTTTTTWRTSISAVRKRISISIETSCRKVFFCFLTFKMASVTRLCDLLHRGYFWDPLVPYYLAKTAICRFAGACYWSVSVFVTFWATCAKIGRLLLKASSQH